MEKITHKQVVITDHDLTVTKYTVPTDLHMAVFEIEQTTGGWERSHMRYCDGLKLYTREQYIRNGSLWFTVGFGIATLAVAIATLIATV